MRTQHDILKYAWPHRRGWILVLIGVLVSSLLALAQPWPMQVLIDAVLLRQPGGTGFTARLAAAPAAALTAGLALAYFLLACAASWLQGWVAYISARAARSTADDLAADLFARLQRRSLFYHARTSVGDSMTRVSSDSWCAAGMTEHLLIRPVAAVVGIGAMLLIMFQLNFWLSVTALAAAPVMAATSLLFGGPVRTAARRRRDSESHVHAHVQQTLAGIHVVQAFGQEEAESARFRRFAERALRAQRHNVMASQLAGWSVGAASAAGHALVLLIGAQQVLATQLSVGALLLFVAYLQTLKGHCLSLSKSYVALQSLSGQAERVRSVLAAPADVLESPAARPLILPRGRVTFQEVTYGYEPDRPILRRVTVDAAPGQIIALVGASGAGKSTLLSMIPRLADPWSGAVLLDGSDVRGLKLRDLRAAIGVVLQESFLLPASIAENIAFGRPSASRTEIERAAQAAQVHEFISALPRGYDTVIGQRGATLSGGERQRIAIARAFLRDAPVLILDEPTSSVDPCTEAALLETLRELMRGRTTFLATHRPSAAAAADAIVVLEEGAVVEIGTHEDLLRREGPYARVQAHNGRARAPLAEAVR